MSSLVLDASVAVASFRPSEPTHLRARARVEQILANGDALFVPSIFDAEVVSALVRRGVPLPSALHVLTTFRLRRIALGARARHGILHVVGATKLRAADAAYVWVAKEHGLTLVSDDAEILARAGGAGVNAVSS